MVSLLYWYFSMYVATFSNRILRGAQSVVVSNFLVRGRVVETMHQNLVIM